MVSILFITILLLLLYYVPGHIQRLKKHLSSYFGIRRNTQDSRISQPTTQPRGMFETCPPAMDAGAWQSLLYHRFEGRLLSIGRSTFFKIATTLGASSDTDDHERKNIQAFLANIRHAQPIYLNIELYPSLSAMDRFKNLVELRTGIQWDWWPLQNPLKLNAGNSQARISWTCVSIFLIYYNPSPQIIFHISIIARQRLLLPKSRIIANHHVNVVVTTRLLYVYKLKNYHNRFKNSINIRSRFLLV